jgi:HSP20 family protein
MLARFERFPSFDTLMGEMLGFSGDIGSLFTNTFESTPVEDAAFAPPLDIDENNEEVVVVAEIPGVRKEDVKISVEKGILSIGGERKVNALSGSDRGLVRERHGGKFTRTVRLPYEVNPDAVSAELSDGLLRIVLPKAEAARAHEIRLR